MRLKRPLTPGSYVGFIATDKATISLAVRSALLAAVATQDFVMLTEAFSKSRQGRLTPLSKLERALKTFVAYGQDYPALYRLGAGLDRAADCLFPAHSAVTAELIRLFHKHTACEPQTVDDLLRTLRMKQQLSS